MTDRQRIRRSEVESLEESESNANSRDDENLVQNWSLTFTEYVTDQTYVKATDFRNGASDDNPSDGFEASTNRSPIGKRPHDGRGEISKQEKLVHVQGHLKSESDILNEKVKSAEREISEKLELQISKAETHDDQSSVRVQGRAMNLGSAAERKSARQAKSASGGKSENRSRSAAGSSKSRQSSKSEKSHTHNKKQKIVRAGTPKEVALPNKADLAKHALLPPIGNGSPPIEKIHIIRMPQDRIPLDDTIRRIGPGGSKVVPKTPPPPVVAPTTGGKVQQIYVRFPGQRTGQMMFAEMNQQSGQVRIVGRDKEKEMLARLAWLLLDAGTSALRTTFDSIHPPLTLRDHLKQSHVKAVLQRLFQQTILTDKQWQLLYPVKKKHISSQKYDSRTLIILLETICHLCPPYPNGWGKEPLPKDGSLSADIVRLQLLFQDLARHEAIAGETYAPWFVQIRDVIVRLGGPPIRIKITRIETELISLEMQQHYIKMLRDTWQPESIRKLAKVHELRTKTSKTRKAYADSKGAEEGLSPEDRVTLKKTYKLLMENVNAEDVIDRLQQSQVVKFSDRQEVLSVSKKQERMQLLLDKISESKLPYALKALFDAIKFKYKKLYEHVMAVRKQTYKEGVVTTIDVSGIVHDALVTSYKTMFSRVYPFPWSDSVHASVRDIYTPLEIIDNDGNKLHQSEMLPAPCTEGKGQRILLEGSSGSGKSVLCAWMAYVWATHPNYFKHSFSQLLYVNMAALEGNLETSVYRSLFPENFKISVSEFWNMLESRADEVLVIVDEYDKGSDVDISEILTGTRLQKSTVILAANPDFMAGNIFVPDTKWFNLGFSEAGIKRCFRNCVVLSELEHEQFEKLYHLAGRESWALRQHLVNPMLAVKAFGVFSVLRKGTMLKEMKTTCDLLEKYGAAMATLYCRKNKIDIIGFEFPDEVLSAIEALDRFAFTCVMAERFSFTEAELLEAAKDPILLKFGAFSKFTQASKLKFSCGISMDFLAARHIADMTYEDMETTILKNKMVKFPKYAQLMSFLCGQYRDDSDTQVLQSLFDQLAARNEYCIRGFFLPAPSISTPIDPESKGKVPRGILSDFSTSLQCLGECMERVDVIGTIAQALPQRLIIKMDSVLSLKCVQGLCLALENKDCAVQEVELEVHQYHHFQLPLFLQLAKHVGKCHNIHSIKITWSSLDIMAKFFAQVMERSGTIESVVLTEDQSRKPVQIKQISAVTWAAFQSACNRMTSVQQLSFLNCRVTAIVNHILQHIPTSIEYLNFNGCAMNQMCAGQIASHLHGNTAIRFLDLSYAKINSSEFVAIFQGMQMCEGIRTVRVRGARLDRPCIIALTEYIKLTHSLEVLDLSDCELTTEMCTQLVMAIKLNRTLQKLVFNDAKITVEGRRVISKTKSKVQRVFVEGLVPIYG